MLYTTITILTFLVGFYLVGMIKTDMVVTQDPVTVTTYDELIASGRRPLWAKLLMDFGSFEHAAKGTKEAKIWEIAVKGGLNNSLIPSDMKQYVSHAMLVAGLKEVLLFSRPTAYFASLAACGFSRTKNFMPNVNVLYRHDPGAPEKLMGHVENHLLDKQVSDKRNKRIKWSFQAGTSDAAINQFFGIPSLLYSPEDAAKVFSSIDECNSNVVLTPHPEMSAVTLWHYVSLYGTACLLFLLAAIVLMVEVVTGRKKVKKLYPVTEFQVD